MKRAAFLALLTFFVGLSAELVAQIPGARIPPRDDDHFWRRKVVNRIDMNEKINRPFVDVESAALYAQTPYGETQGIVVALINGLKAGKYLAYHPDSLNKSLVYEDVVKMAKAIDGSGSGSGDEGWDEGGDEFGDDFDSGENFEEESFTEEGSEDVTSEGASDPTKGGDGGGKDSDFAISPYENVLEFIEDRIFDKNRSDMVYDIEYIRLVWVDPGETLPDKNFICFKYSDLLETLEDCQWKNKFNDAEYRNMREIFELRLFNSNIYMVSGRGVRSLPEADFRRNQLVEFEHHLWCY